MYVPRYHDMSAILCNPRLKFSHRIRSTFKWSLGFNFPAVFILTTFCTNYTRTTKHTWPHIFIQVKNVWYSETPPQWRTFFWKLQTSYNLNPPNAVQHFSDRECPSGIQRFHLISQAYNIIMNWGDCKRTISIIQPKCTDILSIAQIGKVPIINSDNISEKWFEFVDIMSTWDRSCYHLKIAYFEPLENCPFATPLDQPNIMSFW